MSKTFIFPILMNNSKKCSSFLSNRFKMTSVIYWISDKTEKKCWSRPVYYQQVKSFMGFPDSSVGKESTCNAGDLGLIPGSGRSTREGIGYPLQYSWGFLVVHLVKNPLQCRRPWFDSWVGNISWRRERLPTPVFWPREFHGLYSPWVTKSQTLLSDFHFHFQSLLLMI